MILNSSRVPRKLQSKFENHQLKARLRRRSSCSDNAGGALIDTEPTETQQDYQNLVAQKCYDDNRQDGFTLVRFGSDPKLIRYRLRTESLQHQIMKLELQKQCLQQPSMNSPEDPGYELTSLPQPERCVLDSGLVEKKLIDTLLTQPLQGSRDPTQLLMQPQLQTIPKQKSQILRRDTFQRARSNSQKYPSSTTASREEAFLKRNLLKMNLVKTQQQVSTNFHLSRLHTNHSTGDLRKTFRSISHQNTKRRLTPLLGFS